MRRYKRNYRKRSRRTRSRRSYKRRSYRKQKRYGGLSVFKTTRIQQRTQAGPATAGALVGWADSYDETQFPDWSELTFFDEFRLVGIKYKFFPPINSADTVSGNLGIFYAYQDRNDHTAPTTLPTILDRAGLYTRQLNGLPFTLFVRPTTAMSQYRSATTTAYGEGSCWRWQDTANPPEYYGLKCAWNLPSGSTATSAPLYYHVKYYFQFRGAK